MSLSFIEQELSRYYYQITGHSHDINLIIVPNKIQTIFDDEYQIDINAGKGFIEGINERSLLLGVYKFLSLIGVFFHKPGNEYIPNKEQDACSAYYHGKPDNKHRVVCIEGSVSIEHVLSMIDFIPKLQMNGYFVQFKKPYEFFDRFYGKKNHPYLKGETISEQKVDEMAEKMIRSIKERHLVYHAVGHGWTSEVLGISSLGWYSSDIKTLDKDKQDWVAKINGERLFFKNIPMNTQLCYSNKHVQDTFARHVFEYAKKKPEIDVLHIWLADDFNNQCECDECQKHLPSYFYIQILNKIDALLSKEMINTKLMFLVYYELLWVDQDIKLINEDRFIMMYAPITRTYTESMKKEAIDYDKTSISIQPFIRNKNIYPSNVKENIQFLKQWQNHYKGDALVFDYHLMWDGFKEFSHIGLSKVIYEDMHVLKELNLNGLISCQLQRTFFPNCLAMHMMGQSLFDKESLFEDDLNDFYKQVYGKHSQLSKKMIEKTNQILLHKYMRQEIQMVNQEVVTLIEQIQKDIIYFLNNYKLADKSDFVQKNIDLLYVYLNYYLGVTNLIKLKASGISLETLLEQTKKTINSLIDIEKQFESDFDGFYFVHIINEMINKVW